jgi:photosystem II stability/assembly factor-like uncharacterized protein
LFEVANCDFKLINFTSIQKTCNISFRFHVYLMRGFHTESLHFYSMRISRFAIIVMLIIVPQLVHAQLQWQNLGGFGPIVMIYFTDEMHGFLSTGTSPGALSLPEQLFRTTDGGATWKEVTVEHFTNAFGFGIQDMYMLANGQGWACGGCDAGYSLWHTIDGGLTWKAYGAADHRASVAICQTKAGIVVSDFYKQHVRLSTDGGGTFNDIFAPRYPDDLMGMDFSDSVHGVLIASFRTNNPWYYTTDGGVKWDSANISIPSWTVYGQKETPNFFAVPEGFTNKPAVPSTCIRSTDFGKTWKPTFTFLSEMTGCTTGTGSVLYTQTVTPLTGKGGVYHSLDSGVTWVWLGGPNGIGETHFTVCPSSCHNNVIYAAGSDHHLYKAYDSVSGVITQSILSGVLAHSGSAAIIHIGDTANVEVNIRFSAGSKAIGFIPDEAEYSLSFDPNVADPPTINGIIPPDGWKIKSAVIAGDSIAVTLSDTLGMPISSNQNFGSIDGFFGLPPTNQTTDVLLTSFAMRNECELVSGSPDLQNGILREIQIVSNNDFISKEKKYGHRLQVFPNPAKQMIKLFSDDGIVPKYIELFDNTGKNIKKINASELQEWSLSVADLPSGSYTIIAEYSDGNESLKFSVVK